MYENECNTIFNYLKENLPTNWDGKEAILYMKNQGCTNWRQMEWPGFYFQFMCEQILSDNNYFQIPGPTYSNVTFDGFRIIPWDFKAHSIDLQKPNSTKVPTNGFKETCQAIKKYGSVGFIVISGISEYDTDQSFKIWHDKLKGGISSYEVKRIQRGAKSRRRKLNFKPTELTFAFVNNENITECGTFQEGMRNSDGTERNAKVMLDIKNPRMNLITYKF